MSTARLCSLIYGPRSARGDMQAAIGLTIRLVFAAIAASLAYWSFRTNADFWRVTFAKNAETQAFYVALSVTAGAIKFGLPVYSEFFRFRLRDNRPYLAVFAVALIFDLLSGVGYASRSRSEIGAEAAHISERRAALSAQERDAIAALARIPAGRVAARVRAEHDAQGALGPCDGPRAARSDRCARLASLAGELADAEARETVEAKLGDVRAAIAELPAPKESDPQAAAVAGAVNAVLSLAPGAPQISEAAAKWSLALILVLLIELGPITCARAAVASRPLPAPPSPPAPQKVPPRIIVAPDAANSQDAPSPPPAVAAPPRRSRPGFDLLEALRQADAGGPCPSWLKRAPDGWLYLSQQDAAEAAGVSKPTIGRRLKALQTGGALRVHVTNTGTAIKLLYPSKSTRAA